MSVQELLRKYGNFLIYMSICIFWEGLSSSAFRFSEISNPRKITITVQRRLVINRQAKNKTNSIIYYISSLDTSTSFSRGKMLFTFLVFFFFKVRSNLNMKVRVCINYLGIIFLYIINVNIKSHRKWYYTQHRLTQQLNIIYHL